eukprot:CAMPEP_0201582540 /NCGR_PEP_ID=MMETSP0190_2-20130828/86793_1 /ASSEMBLY_ACC=CAM_ASM_000263 /TAXON_ID=37353 /ORGANISM="Rosalina sp." /LENGTH=323 /DNA_ID=CAMNT_0048022667 /DNA_START=82 /DNA_END=1050 /DNA_ORIENTATION=-
MKLLITLICIGLNIIFAEEEAIQSVEIGTDGEIKTEEPKHPNGLEVIFENQSGKSVELYWDDSKEGVLQGELDHTNQITINTFLGHRFYYTPANSSGSKENLLYEITMMEHTGLVTLYNEKIMSERGAEFERKKGLWMKEYYDKTGRRWQNYYPREPVTHNYYQVNETGQVIEVSSSRTHFEVCQDGDLSDADIATLDTMEQEWLSDEKNTKISEKCEEDPEDESCKKVPPSYQSENDDMYFGRMNGTTYCRPKVDGNDNSNNMTFEIINICAHGPVAFRIFNFLSEAEMEHIKMVGSFIGMKRSTVSEEALETIDRTSQTVW